MPEKSIPFGELLSQAVKTISLQEQKKIATIQDELGYAVGKSGGSAIEYWRRGIVPANLEDLEKLARELHRRKGVSVSDLERLLYSARHPDPKSILASLPAAAAASPSNYPPNHTLPSFIVGPPITNPRQFFGRGYEVAQIFNLWRHFPLQNVAVVGQKRSGKTSLLHYLMNITRTEAKNLRLGQHNDWLLNSAHYRWVFVDFQNQMLTRRERLLRYLLANFELSIPEPCSIENFMEVVSEHLNAPVIILMDEIGAGVAAPELDEAFWGSLRSLGSNYTRGNLGFILSAHDYPYKLAQDEGKPSPFFNIFGHTFTLKPFTEAEARALIAASPMPFSEEDIVWILAQSGCWPCALQILCHARLSSLQQGENGENWQKSGLTQLAQCEHLL